MNDDIIKRRKQIFNTIRTNNVVLESEKSTFDIKEAHNLAENAESMGSILTNSVDDSTLSGGICAESNSDNIVILNDEDGSEIYFEFLDLITYRKKEYVVLLPIDDTTDQVVILQVESVESEDEESYVSVDNVYTLEAVFSLFKERNRHKFKFTD